MKNKILTGILALGIGLPLAANAGIIRDYPGDYTGNEDTSYKYTPTTQEEIEPIRNDGPSLDEIKTAVNAKIDPEGANFDAIKNAMSSQANKKLDKMIIITTTETANERYISSTIEKFYDNGDKEKFEETYLTKGKQILTEKITKTKEGYIEEWYHKSGKQFLTKIVTEYPDRTEQTETVFIDEKPHIRKMIKTVLEDGTIKKEFDKHNDGSIDGIEYFKGDKNAEFVETTDHKADGTINYYSEQVEIGPGHYLRRHFPINEHGIPEPIGDFTKSYRKITKIDDETTLYEYDDVAESGSDMKKWITIKDDGSRIVKFDYESDGTIDYTAVIKTLEIDF